MHPTHYSWHAGENSLGKAIWPVPLALSPDELLSTWIVRLALANGCEPLVLTGFLWPGWRPWTIDLDRASDFSYLEPLSRYSGIRIGSLVAASLRAVARATTGTSKKPNTTGPWILSLGTRNRKRLGGLQYCSYCFNGDATPFYRLQWRLAWHTCCPNHQVILNDRCFWCRAAIEPHRLTTRHSNTAYCARCGDNHGDSLHLRAVSSAMIFQSLADAVVCSGVGRYGSVLMTACEWFIVVRYFLMLLRCATRHPNSNLTKCLVSIHSQVGTLKSTMSGLPFELLPPFERAQMLCCVYGLIQAGPKELKTAMINWGLTSATMMQDWPSVPYPINELVNALPSRRRTRKRSGKCSQKPKPPQVVMRMWAKLCRKNYG